MYIDNYEIVTLGNKYEGNKTKKNQVLTHMHSDDGIQAKDLLNLIESYDDCVGCHLGEDGSYANEFEEEYPDAHKFIKQHRSNISEAKTADLDKHISDLGQWVGEHTDWVTDVTIQTTRLQA